MSTAETHVSTAFDTSPSRSPGALWRLILFYGLLTTGCVVCFFAIRSVGERLAGPTAMAVSDLPSAASPAKQADPLPRLLMALAAVILVGRVLASILQHFGQPPVIGEVI